MSTQDRGFKNMDPARQRAIASMGGKTAHARGVAHKWTPEEAAAAGRKGGLLSGRHKRRAAQVTEVTEVTAAAEVAVEPQQS